MIVPRDYQDEAVQRALMFFASGSKTKPILDLPTGSGKSVIIALIVKALGDKKVLIFQPNQELLEQNYKKYDEVIKNNPELERASVYSASFNVREKGRVTFATIGSIFRNAEDWADIDYVLIDECHRVSPKKEKEKKGRLFNETEQASMYVQFFDIVKAKVLGLTATPYRLKTYSDSFTGGKYSQINLLNRESPKFFNEFLYTVPIRKLYDDKYLCPINYLPLNFDTSALLPNSTGAEFTDDSVKKAILNNKILEKIPDVLRQAYEKGQRSALVFVRSVEDAAYLASIVPFSDYIHAKTDKKDRSRIISDFKKGNVKTLFNVSVLTEGFDYPALDTVIIARPTMSLTLYVQMVGRGMRNAPGKERAALVDMCGNVKRFGKVEELRIENDPYHGWVLRNDTRIISGRRLDSLI